MARAAPMMKTRMAAIFTSTMMSLARALSLMPYTSSQVSPMTTRKPGRLNHAPVNSPPWMAGVVSACGNWIPSTPSIMCVTWAEKPTATAMLDTAYSSTRFQPIIQATNSPMVA